MSKITIGIPFYNCEKYLKSAINSVLCQSFKDFKLVLINDGSTDMSLKVAESFIDDRIELINDNLNKGLIFRLNQLIDHTNSEYFARMDSDDIMFPDRLFKQLTFLENNPDIDVVGSAAISIDEMDGVVGYRNGLNNFSPHSILKYGAFIHPTVMGKTRWFRNYYYLENYDRAEDLELWLRSCENSFFKYLPEPTLFYREGSINVNNYLTSAKTVGKIYKKYKKYFESNIEYFTALSILSCKTSLYSIFSFFKNQQYLAKKRSEPLPVNEFIRYSDIILKIKEFK